MDRERHPPAHAVEIAQLRLLGEAALLDPQGQRTLRLEARDAALLAWLALEGPQTRRRAAAWLWPDVDEDRARGNLRQRLFRLRRAGVAGLSNGTALLQLPPGLTTDLDQGLAHAVDTPERGVPELLAGLHFDDAPECSEWLERQRQRWQQRLQSALAERADGYEAQRDYIAALPLARRILELAPLEERAHARLMRLHYLSGDRVAALAAHRRCCDLLQRELGVEPGSDIAALHRLLELAAPLPGSAAAASQPTASLARPPRMVGRESFSQALRQAVAHSRCALVTGVPGVGKTRLLSELAASESSAWAGARPMDRHQPYAVLSRLLQAPVFRGGDGDDPATRDELRRLTPRADALTHEAPDRPFEVTRLRWAVRRRLRSAQDQGLRCVILDDLQYADEASLTLLLGLAAGASDSDSGAGLAWILAAREGELPPILRDWAQAGREGHHRSPPASAAANFGAPSTPREADPARPDGLLRLALEPLDASSIEQLIGTLEELPVLEPTAWAQALHRHTGGNPLFLLQTLQQCIDEGWGPRTAQLDERGRLHPPARLPAPPQVGELLGRRFAGLSEPAQALAQLAAVAGEDFTARLATRVLHLTPSGLTAPWQELERAGLWYQDTLAHDLIREAVRQAMPRAIQRLLHAEVAQALAADGALPAILAAHWWEAGHWAQAANAYTEQARRARGLSARREELGALELAAQAWRQAGGDAPPFEVLHDMFHAACYVEDLAGREIRCRALEAAAITPPQRALALEARAMLANDNHQDAEALAAAEEATLIARACHDARLELAAVRLRARALSRLARWDEASALIEHHRHGAAARHDDSLGARALIEFAATALLTERPALALELLQPALARCRALQDWSLLRDGLQHLAWAQASDDDILASTRSYEEARAVLQSIGIGQPPPGIHDMALARQYRFLGRYTQALSLLETTLALQQHSGDDTMVTLTRSELALLLQRLGDPAAALAALGRPHPRAAPSTRAGWLLTRARLRGSGDPAALAELDEALAVVQREGRPYYLAVLQHERIAHLPPDEGLSLARQTFATAQRLGLKPLLQPMRRCLAEALLRCARSDEALPLVQTLTCELAARPPTALHPPLAWWTAWRVQRALGRHQEAQSARLEGRRWLLETALPNLPPGRDSCFLHDDVHADLLGPDLPPAD